MYAETAVSGFFSDSELWRKVHEGNRMIEEYCSCRCLWSIQLHFSERLMTFINYKLPRHYRSRLARRQDQLALSEWKKSKSPVKCIFMQSNWHELFFFCLDTFYRSEPDAILRRTVPSSVRQAIRRNFHTSMRRENLTERGMIVATCDTIWMGRLCQSILGVNRLEQHSYCAANASIDETERTDLLFTGIISTIWCTWRQ